MKRIVAFALTLIFVLVLAAPSFAASNSDAILDSLRAGVQVNGKTVKIPQSYINQAENYFVSHHITDAQAAFMLGQINAAKAAIQSNGITDLKKMDSTTKQKVLAQVQAAANTVDLKLTLGADKTVKIADSNGSVVFSDGNPIKTTGLQVYPGFAVPFITLLAAIFACCFFIHKNKLLGNEIL